MKAGLAIFTILLLLHLLHPSPVSSWKKDEFRNCNQTPFCKRGRTRSPNPAASTLIASDVRIVSGDLVARISDPDHHAKPLLLRLSAYQGGVLRLAVDEDPSLNPPKKRFQPPDVVAPEFDASKLWLQRLSASSDANSSVVYLSPDHEAVLRHRPFEVYVRAAIASQGGARERRLISLNHNGLFDFEQLREKRRRRKKDEEGNELEEEEDDEDWEERFRSHTDSRPYGPQSITFDVSFHGADFVYGIPEHASTSLALKPTRGPGVDFSEPYRLFNLDVFEYDHESPFGIYGSIPFMLAHGKSSGTAGFFWLNAAEMQIDVLAPGWAAADENRIDTLWMSEAGIVDAFFFLGPGPKDVVEQYTSVTGRPSLPQLFATAYHQCRWNYRDEEDVAEVDAKFDEFDIPYDVLWLDIEHTDGKRYFTWDKALFPHPEEMQRNLAAKGRKMVTIVDPHIKRDEDFHLHKEATEKGYYVKDAKGKDFDGWCWPGSSSYPDMLNPEIREWWADKFSLQSYVGSTPTLYIWNDMNEPSVFNGPEVSMPRDAVHYGGFEHREVHNAYGYYFHMATANGLLKRGDGKDRPFVLSRAFFPGSQRYGAVWTGDNTADWDQLKASVPMILTLGLTGMSFSGADVGGFFGNPETELLVRWYQLGAYYPFFRAHAHHDTRRREPWLFGDANTKVIREAIRTRYTLLPYFYTLFRAASMTGVPVMRPLWMEFPTDEATYNNGDAFMVGDSLLVQGIYEAGAKHVSVYLPTGQVWYDMRNGMQYSGGKSHKLDVTEDTIPCFQKAGTIVPRKDRFRRSTMQMGEDPYTLVIALNSSGSAEGELYVDDGQSFEYQQGAFIHRRFVFAHGKLSSVNLSPSGSHEKHFSSDSVVERILLLGLPSGAKEALVDPSNNKIKVEAAPLVMRTGLKPVALVIRKPNVRIVDDWTIKIL